MSIRQTAYDSTACAGFMTIKIVEGLRKAFIQQMIKPIPNTRLVMVYGSAQLDEIVPVFAHPVTFEEGGVTYVAVDARTTGRWNPNQQEFETRDMGAFNAVKLRGLLTETWIEDSPDILRNISNLPLNVYANWLGEAIGKRLALDPGDQFTVSILAAIYYLNLFWSSEKSSNPDKLDKTLLVSIITRTLAFKADAVYDVVEAHPGMSSLDEFCEACKSVTQSVRMRDLNPTTLFGMVGGYWYGNNGRELICVALDNPPTWLTLLYEAITNKGFRNAGLTKVLDRGVYRKHTDSFVIQLRNLVKVPTN